MTIIAGSPEVLGTVQVERSMRRADRNRWVRALRSGHYQQGRSRLCRTTDGTHRWCCLGVAIEELCDGYWTPGLDLSFRGSWAYDGRVDVLTVDVARQIGLDEHVVLRLAQMNDLGRNFEEIATWIETFIPVHSP